MTTLLVVHGGAAARRRWADLLRRDRHDVAEAADGAQALALARAAPPDAVVAHACLPTLDGFELAAAIRADAALAAVPVLLVVDEPDAANMRRAMQAGADDCVAAARAHDELGPGIAALLRKKRRSAEAFERAVRQRVTAWRRHWAAATARSRRDDDYGLAPAGASAQRQVEAAVLFADIRNFSALAERLDSAEVAELLAAYFERACRPVLAHGGSHLKFIGDGLMSLFTAGANDVSAPRRALSAAFGVALAAHEFRGWVDERFAGRGLPSFAIGVGIHAGPVTLCRFGAGAAADITAIGDAVNVAARLEAASKELGWTVVASRAVLDGAGPGVQTRGQAALALRGRRDPVEVAEVTGLDHAATGGSAGSATAVRAAVELNSVLAAAAPAGSPVTIVAGAGRRRRGS